MKHKPPTKQRGLAIARHMKTQLLSQGIPVIQVLLFGSLAEGKTHRWSDVDIAVVHHPFLPDRMEERSRIRSAREDFDVPMDIVCFRDEDMVNKYLGLAQEVKKHGIPV